MSRFVAPNLSLLGDLPFTEVSYDEAEQRRVEYLKAAYAEYGIDYDVETLETDPMRIGFSEAGAYVEMLIDQRINEAIRQMSLAKSQDDGALADIAGTYYGISRLEGEDRETFRSRIALAPEAFSTAGPEGAYIFHALEIDGVFDVKDAAVYSEEDEATYSDTLHADAYSRGVRSTPFAGRSDGDPVLAPEGLVIIHSTTEYGPVDQPLLDRCWDALSREEVRPLCDNIRVEAAERVEYAVNMTITYARGADPAPLVAEAKRRCEAYVAARERVGVVAERLGIGGAGYVSNIEAVTLTSPSADVGGGSKQVPICTGVTVTAVQSDGSWQ